MIKINALEKTYEVGIINSGSDMLIQCVETHVGSLRYIQGVHFKKIKRFLCVIPRTKEKMSLELKKN